MTNCTCCAVWNSVLPPPPCPFHARSVYPGVQYLHTVTTTTKPASMPNTGWLTMRARRTNRRAAA